MYTWQVLADIAVAVAVPAGAAVLYFAGRMTKREILFLVYGICIGLSFELFLWIMGPGFIVEKMDSPLPSVLVYVCHALWDGGIFMAGYLLASLLLRRARADVCASFDWRELAIMVAWGAVSAFAVELTGNGVIWEYQPQSWNPVWITIAGQGYTAFIQILWVIVPFVFYFGSLRINRMAEGKKT